MKKIFILLLCAVFALGTFTACDEDSSKKRPSSKPNLEDGWTLPF